MKKISLSFLGEKFEIELEEEFFEFVKDDIKKLKNATAKDILMLILKNKKEEFETSKNLKNIIKKLNVT